jgi:hypothetical protein
MRRLVVALLAIVLVCSKVAPLAAGKDVFITIGGGYNASGNQLSLEKNVHFQQQTLARIRVDKPLHEIYFADGDDAASDLQYSDDQFEQRVTPARRLMAELLGNESTMNLRYRNHEITNCTGPSEPKLIERRIRQLAGELGEGDRLVIYATAHGGSAESDGDNYIWDDEEEEFVESDSNEYNTSLYLWDDESITASDLSRWLDAFDKDVVVVLVMVQCYSGGFSHTIFHDADSQLGLSRQLRCGFFSQVHDRPSAGCTPDVVKSQYQEYSSFFWAALGGQSRDGKPITTADYNDDGMISLAEAHAYAIIESNTIDIPICTTDAFLREYSVLEPRDAEDESQTEGGGLFGMFGGAGSNREADKQFVKLEGLLEELGKRARPEQQAVLAKLAEAIDIKGKPSVRAVKNRLKVIESQLAEVETKYAAAESRYARLGKKLADSLKKKWPELDEPYAPLAMELASERADEFIATVEALPDYQPYLRAKEKRDAAYDEYSRVDHLEAKAQRLLRTCENIVLEANLSQVAPREIVDRYERLLAVETSTLATATAPPSTTVDTAAATD